MVERQIEARGIRDRRLLAAMQEIPRHQFMDKGLWARAYDDNPLPIGDGQTISQPYMVALMTDAMGLTGREKVLEIGTGSGYQTAVLAKLADWVFSVEAHRGPCRVRPRPCLEGLKIFNVNLVVGDGTKGLAARGAL